MEPSRATAGRRRREMLAQARTLDEELGPDESKVVFKLEDGWTVRRVDRREDQRREGHLLRHCLRTSSRLDPNTYSLRDPENLPHVSFAVYRVKPDDDLSEVPLGTRIGGSLEFVQGGAALMFVTVKGPLKPERRAQLVTFGEGADLSRFDWFPSSTAGRIRAVRTNFNFD